MLQEYIAVVCANRREIITLKCLGAIDSMVGLQNSERAVIQPPVKPTDTLILKNCFTMASKHRNSK